MQYFVGAKWTVWCSTSRKATSSALLGSTNQFSTAQLYTTRHHYWKSRRHKGLRSLARLQTEFKGITVAKANSVLSLIKRFGKEFNDLFVIKSLYTSLVLSTIDYGCIVWMPAFEVDIKRIEYIQKQFLLFCLRDLGWRNRFQLLSYRHRLNFLNMLTIRDRQKIACCLFVFDVMNNNTRAEQISRNFEPNRQHYDLRQKRTFRKAPTRTIFSANSTVNRCTNLFNILCQGRVHREIYFQISIKRKNC